MESPVSIYLRLIDYNSLALTIYGTHVGDIASIKDTFDAENPQFIRISKYSSDVDQTLNIASQSAGAGAGKIEFNPLVITKFSDALSPLLFVNAASGTPFKTAEVFFVNKENVLVVKHTYKLVAVKSVAWAAASGDAGIIETVSFEYGGLVITVFQQGPDGKINVLQGGWNRVRNIQDSNDSSVII